MATQGLVTVMSGKRVLMKVVAGNDGYEAPKVAEKLRKAWPCTADKAYDIALDAGFGNHETLVVVTESEIIYKDGDTNPRLYRSTLQQPAFNPRWPEGTTDHLEIIKV